MDRKIRTYEDLVYEQQRLTSRLRSQEEQIKVDIAGVKEKFSKKVDSVSKLSSRDKVANPFMMFGLDMAIDYLFRRVLFARAGFLLKAVVPFVIKNYSSHVIGDKIRDTMRKQLRNVFTKIRPATQSFPTGDEMKKVTE